MDMGFIKTGINGEPLHKPDNREMTISEFGIAKKKAQGQKKDDTAVRLARELAEKRGNGKVNEDILKQYM